MTNFSTDSDGNDYKNYVKTHCPSIEIMEDKIIFSRVTVPNKYVISSTHKDDSAIIRFVETKTIVRISGRTSPDQWQIFSVEDRVLSPEEEMLAMMVWATIRTHFLNRNKSNETSTASSTDSIVR
jgi:hypothetical protein